VDKRINAKKHELLDLPIVIRVNKFDEDAAKNFAEDMQKAHELTQPIIPIVIDSYGGYVDALVSMISECQHSKIPIATICQGKAMSCGSILLSCGEEGMRFMDPNSRVMIHEVSSASWGKNEEIQASAKEVDRLNKFAMKLMAKNCGHDADYFLNIISEKKNADWYLPARECKRHNLVNHLKVPEMRIKVGVEINFNENGVPNGAG
tara:strand:+ start:3615 stop:4232 length:618 start_codon:yes stop_codon:yes gene_type:complete